MSVNGRNDYVPIPRFDPNGQLSYDKWRFQFMLLGEFKTMKQALELVEKPNSMPE